MTRYGVFLLLAVLSAAALAAEAPASPPDQALMGDYEGTLTTGGADSPLVAQVIALGEGRFRANMLEQFDRRAEPLAVMEGTPAAMKGTTPDGTAWTGRITAQGFSGTSGAATFAIHRVERPSPTLGAEAPEGAAVLFDGTGMDAWRFGRADGPTWTLTPDGAMEVRRGAGSAVSRRSFGDQRLHLEFRTPFEPRARGQERGNSGVYVQGLYEIQVLDSYGLEGADNECGGIYRVARPLVNMCAPPLQWQTYDITFHAARYDADGKKLSNARITVLHNGVPIHQDLVLPAPTAGGIGTEDGRPAPLMLQNHGDLVQYRNVWVADLEEAPAWRLGSQAWTFNRLTFLEAVDRVAALGMKYIEMYPGQQVGPDLPDKTGPGMGPQATAAVRARLKERGVTLVSYGVTGLPGEEAACRAIFDWAKGMGIETIVAEPAQGDLPMIDKLCTEYGINVALHNHPRPSRYWNPDTVLEATKGLSKRIGSCADTGHWARSGLDPVECLKKLQGRIITVHFKDLNVKSAQGHDVPWGTGGCDAAGMLAELKRQGFRGVFSMEYEARWEMADLAACVKFFREEAARLEETAK